MLKKIKHFCADYLLLFVVVIICVELVGITAGIVNGSLDYVQITYVLIGLIGLVCGFKKWIAGKWFLLAFFGLQIFFIKTLDVEFGFNPSFGFPISCNSSSTENGQLTKLLWVQVDLLAIYLFSVVNTFYKANEQEADNLHEDE